MCFGKLKPAPTAQRSIRELLVARVGLVRCKPKRTRMMLLPMLKRANDESFFLLFHLCIRVRLVRKWIRTKVTSFIKGLWYFILFLLSFS